MVLLNLTIITSGAVIQCGSNLMKELCFASFVLSIWSLKTVCNENCFDICNHHAVTRRPNNGQRTINFNDSKIQRKQVFPQLRVERRKMKSVSKSKQKFKGDSAKEKWLRLTELHKNLCKREKIRGVLVLPTEPSIVLRKGNVKKRDLFVY